MKLVMVHGSSHRGNTWHYADMLREALEAQGPLTLQEFFLPKELPDHCVGCFSCIKKGEETCPHAALVTPIAEATAEADVIVLTSPIYALDVSGGMKTLLDHLCYRWLVHRPDPRIFSKLGVTVATTAGSGLGHASKTMRQSLRFWGVRHALSLKRAVSASVWSEVSEKKRARMRKDAEAAARKLMRMAKRPFGSPLRRIVFFAIRSAMRKGNWLERDRNHWKDRGWLDKVNPFKT